MLAGFTEDDMKGLSASERAIMEAGDEDDTDGMEALANGGDDGADADKGKGAAADDKGDKDGKGADAADEVDEEDEDLTDTGVTFTKKTPDDAQKTRDDLQAREDESFQKLMDGEITPAEYQVVKKEVAGKMEELLTASITDNVTGELTKASTMKAWNTEVDAVVKAAVADGLDYKKDAKLMTEFDRLVKVFGSEATDAGMSDEGLKASRWALNQAHETMMRRHGKTRAEPAGDDGKGKPVKRAKADLSEIPPTLGKAPIAADAAITDEFAHLDSLSGSALERAVAKLTPEQMERYSS